MDQAINIFLLEDRKADVELVKRAVLKFIPSAIFTHAISEEEFLEKITWMNYDIVLADYHLPAYTGLEALLHVKEHYPKLPFIFVTGTLDNEVEAAQAILKGANGYVLKGNLKELAIQVPKALSQAKETLELTRQRMKRDNDCNIMLQEARELIGKAPDFPKKAHILQLLREVSELKSTPHASNSSLS